MLAPNSRRPSPTHARRVIPALETLESRVVPQASSAPAPPLSPPTLNTSPQALFNPVTIFQNGEVLGGLSLQMLTVGGETPLAHLENDIFLLGLGFTIAGGLTQVGEGSGTALITGTPPGIALGTAGIYATYFLGITDVGFLVTLGIDAFNQLPLVYDQAKDALLSSKLGNLLGPLLGQGGPSITPPVTTQVSTQNTGPSFGGGGGAGAGGFGS
jgi:hypothetical protein